MTCLRQLLRPLPTALALCALLTACGDDSGGASSSGSSGAGSATTTSVGTTAATTAAQTGLVDDSSGGDDGPGASECILWNAEECGAGRKCMPYSLEDDRIPDEIRCCDAVDSPAVDGEPCQATDYNGSCLDNCAPGSMCVLDNEDSLTGLCRQFCDPGGNDCQFDQTCKPFFELFAAVPNTPVCMDRCDPLQQNCSPPGWHCIPDTVSQAGQSGFLCSPPPPSTPKQALETCALANDCEAGLACVPKDRIPGCAFTSCCTPYCSLSEGDGACTDVHPDLACTDWMSAEPEWQDVGACTLPAQ